MTLVPLFCLSKGIQYVNAKQYNLFGTQLLNTSWCRVIS